MSPVRCSCQPRRLRCDGLCRQPRWSWLAENSLPDDVTQCQAPFTLQKSRRLDYVRVMETSESPAVRLSAELREDILLQTVLRLSAYISPRYWCFITMCAARFSQTVTLGAVFLAIGLMFWGCFALPSRC